MSFCCMVMTYDITAASVTATYRRCCCWFLCGGGAREARGRGGLQSQKAPQTETQHPNTHFETSAPTEHLATRGHCCYFYLFMNFFTQSLLYSAFWKKPVVESPSPPPPPSSCLRFYCAEGSASPLFLKFHRGILLTHAQALAAIRKKGTSFLFL